MAGLRKAAARSYCDRATTACAEEHRRQPCTLSHSMGMIHDASSATCPMCHTTASVAQTVTNSAEGWRCIRCGQHWDARRLTTVAAYAAWTAEHARLDSGATADHALGRADAHV